MALVVAAVAAMLVLAWLVCLAVALVYDTVRLALRREPGIETFRVTAVVWHAVVGRLWPSLRGAPTLRVDELDELRALTPRQFEDAVATLLRDTGFKSVRRVGGPGDLQADVTARTADGKTVVVQCKRYTGATIGSRDIQTFIGMAKIHHRADIGIFVTTSGFTRAASDLASKHDDIQLWDGAKLAEILARTRGKAPRGSQDAARKLKRAGHTPRTLVAMAREQIDLPPPTPVGSECRCTAAAIEWVGFIDDDLVQHLMCPSCYRFATQEEIAAAMPFKNPDTEIIDLRRR